MKKQNCWDFKKCGRGPDGKKDCPAAKDSMLNGIHGGMNAGRACWASAGTNGPSAATGTFAIVLKDCLRCDFFRLVRTEEQNSDDGFSATRLGMLKLLQQGTPSQSAPRSTGNGDIDADLKDEFVQELKRLSYEKDTVFHDLRDEFAKEVERLNAKTGKIGK
jgi:hypothetical protein